MKTIFIAPYRNVSIRYILSTDIFKFLKKQKDLKIVVFLKRENIEYYKKKYLGEDSNIYFEDIFYDNAYSSLRSGVGSFFNLVRMFTYGKRGKYINNAPKIWGQMYAEQFRNSSLKGKLFVFFAKFISFLNNRSFVIRKSIVFLESLFLNGDIYDKYFINYKPKLLIVSSTGYMIDPFFMRSAKRNNCKVLSIVHSWDNPTTKAYAGGNPDYVIAWNSIMKKELNIFQDIPKEKIYVGGIAHWDVYFNGELNNYSRDDFYNNFELSKNKKTILYATSAPIMFKTTFDVIEHLLKQISSGKIDTSCQLLVRLHPNYLANQKNSDNKIIDLYKKRIDKINSMYGDLVSFCLPEVNFLENDYELPIEDIKNLGKILQNIDLLLTEYSTLMIEGSIFDKPVINVALYKYRDTDKPISIIEDLNHIKRVIKTGATRQVYDIDQLLNEINTYLKYPNIDKKNREKLVKQEITINKGNAGECIGRFIYELL